MVIELWFDHDWTNGRERCWRQASALALTWAKRAKPQASYGAAHISIPFVVISHCIAYYYYYYYFCWSVDSSSMRYGYALAANHYTIFVSYFQLLCPISEYCVENDTILRNSVICPSATPLTKWYTCEYESRFELGHAPHKKPNTIKCETYAAWISLAHFSRTQCECSKSSGQRVSFYRIGWISLAPKEYGTRNGTRHMSVLCFFIFHYCFVVNLLFVPHIFIDCFFQCRIRLVTKC